MSTHPYIPFYVDDYDAHTAHLSPAEDGVYMRLLRLCWRTPGCSLPNDPVWIARKIRLTAEQFEEIAKPVLEEFFTLSRGRFVQKRLKAEYDDISRKKIARQKAGKIGGSAKARKTKEKVSSNAMALPEHTRAFPEPEPEPEPIGIGGGVERAAAIEDWPEDGQIVDVAIAATSSPWLDPQKSPGLTLTAGRFAAWRRAGASFRDDVLPAIAAACAKRREPIHTWGFFDGPVARAKAERLRDLTPAEARPANVVSLPDRIAAEHDAAKDLARQRLEKMGIAWDG